MTSDPATDHPIDLYRQYEMLADAVDRLAAFRADQAEQLALPTYPLFLDDLDAVIVFLARTVNSDGKNELAGAGRADPLFNTAQSLSDADLAGEHSAMQDGVDDVRKDALAREMDRREI